MLVRRLLPLLLSVVACNSFGISPAELAETDASVPRAPDASILPTEDASTGTRDGDVFPPDSSLLGSWSFEEAAGILAADTSGHGHDATLEGDATFAAGGVNGGRGVSLAGNGGIVVSALDGTAFPKEGTLSVWYRLTTFAVAGEARNVFADYDSSRDQITMRIKNAGDHETFQIGFHVASPARYVFAHEYPAALNVWVHLVVTWSPQRGAVYLDGKLVKAGDTTSSFVPTNQAFELGDGALGTLDEVRLYSRALPENEATALR